MSIIQNASFVTASANIATILFGIIIVIQLLLAAGVLPVTMAWGGRQEVLTPGLRIASIVSAIILGFFAYIIRYRAGLTGAESIPVWIEVLAWIVTAFMLLNTFSNLASQSKTEKMVFVPITSILTIACFIVSVS
jgi:hypothetical protein